MSEPQILDALTTGRVGRLGSVGYGTQSVAPHTLDFLDSVRSGLQELPAPVRRRMEEVLYSSGRFDWSAALARRTPEETTTWGSETWALELPSEWATGFESTSLTGSWVWMPPPPAAPLPAVISAVVRSLEEEPLEDGMCHPAEELVAQALAQDRAAFSRWLTNLVREGSPQEAPLADVLKCLGRLPAAEAREDLLALMREALRHPDVEVRDAAIGALELWDTPAALDLLREHKDPVPWLQEYVRSILESAS